MARIIKSFCISHTPPVFTPPVPYQMLCPFPLGLADEVVIRDDRFGPDIDGANLAEYSQLFGLYELIKSGDIVADDLYLFQYRKFLSPRMGGLESQAPWVRIVMPEDCAAQFPTVAELEAYDARVIVGSYFDMGESIPANYARVHVIEDMVMFAAACARNPLLNQEDVKAFATMHGIVPSPALCYIKTELFMKIMEILLATWNEFRGHYSIKREGYQRRVMGYLLERLHSYLLCKWLMDGSEPNINIWHRFVVAGEKKASS